MPEGAFFAAFDNVETYEAQSTSSSIGMVDLEFGNRTSLVVDPPDGRIPPLTPGARQREAAVDAGWQRKAGPEDFNNIHRCITTGVPRLGGNFGAGPYTYYQIVQTPRFVVLVMEAFHDARIIPLDSRPPLPKRIAQWNGDSRGHREGDVLVVDTRNFSSKSYFRRCDRRPASGRTVHADRPRHAHLSADLHRPDDLDDVLDSGDTTESKGTGNL